MFYQYSHDDNTFTDGRLMPNSTDIVPSWLFSKETIESHRESHICAHCPSQWIWGAYHPVKQKCTIITVYWFHMSPTAASWLSSVKESIFGKHLFASGYRSFAPSYVFVVFYASWMAAPRYDCPHKSHLFNRGTNGVANIFWVRPAWRWTAGRRTVKLL